MKRVAVCLVSDRTTGSAMNWCDEVLETSWKRGVGSQGGIMCPNRKRNKVLALDRLVERESIKLMGSEVRKRF